jgi:alanyl-tRNA synthetase
MQQHTGQHLLSAVLHEHFHAQTVSFHMGSEACTIDLDAPSLSREQLAEAERMANDVVTSNRAVSVSFEDAGSAEGLRKASGREGTLRIIEIDGLDRSACGGTHVRRTGEIGCILLRGTEKIRGTLRLEFVCGARAIRRARADYDALTATAQAFSAALDETPKLAQALLGRAAEADKARRRMALELAGYRGRQLAAETAAAPSGRRAHVREAALLDEEARAEAQAFTTAPNSVFIAWSASPPALLLAVSADSGLHAGNLVKAAVSAAGGRGGGSATVAQGSFPDSESLAGAVRRLSES